MSFDVIMPQMGESIAEATILKWHKKVGDLVEKDETLYEISTDKVDAEIPSPSAGIITEILVDINKTVAVGTVVARIGNHQWPVRITATLRTFLTKVASTLGKEFDEKNPGPIVAELGSMARMIGATTQNTANPTMLKAGYKENVIPQHAKAVIDGRFLPGFEEEFIATIRELAGPNVKVSPIIHDIALENSFSGELVEAMCLAIKECDPEGIPVPYVMSGGIDNKGLSK